MSENLPAIVDRMPLEARKPRAGPLLEPNEVIALGLVYALQFEFWKGDIGEDSQVVHAVLDALHQAGYKIVPR